MSKHKQNVFTLHTYLNEVTCFWHYLSVLTEPHRVACCCLFLSCSDESPSVLLGGTACKMTVSEWWVPKCRSYERPASSLQMTASLWQLTQSNNAPTHHSAFNWVFRSWAVCLSGAKTTQTGKIFSACKCFNRDNRGVLKALQKENTIFHRFTINKHLKML